MNYFAEIEPGFILMVIIWLFSSFFSKNKKAVKNSPKEKKKAFSFEAIMKKLGELSDVDINHPQEIFPKSEEEFLEEEFVDPEFHFEEIDLEEKESIQEEVETESIIKNKKPLSEVKLFGTPLQKAMVLKEILDKPRALRPFNFSGFNDA